MRIFKTGKYPPAPGADIWLVAGAALIPAILTFIVYLPALENGFVEWDDHIYIVDSPLIRAIDLSFFKVVFSTAIHCNWHPLTTFSWALDYSVWGLDARGFHLTSVVLHSLNTLLASALATMALARYTRTAYAEKRNLFAGAVTALLFGLHPYHVESVAWVSERKDLLCQIFYFLSVISYLKYSGRPASGRPYYAAALVLFALALMSKPMAVSLPLVLLLLDMALAEGRPFRKIVLEKAPFFALSVISSVITILAQRTGNTIITLEEHAFVERFASAVRAYAFYLYKTVLPAGLSPYYPFVPKDRLFDGVFLVSVLLLAAITAYSAAAVRKRRYLLASWLYFLVTLSPVIGLVQVGGQAAADRYAYLPSFGPFVLAGAFTAWLFFARRRYLAVSIFLVLMTVSLSYATIRQIPVWKDTVSLWSKVIEEYPESAPLAYYNRGVLRGEAGNYGEALADYGKAIILKPDHAMAYYNRALVLSRLGRDKEAADDLTKAIVLNPGDADAYINRGAAYARLGDFDAAVSDLKRSIELNPENPAAYQNLKIIQSRTGARE